MHYTSSGNTRAPFGGVCCSRVLVVHARAQANLVRGAHANSAAGAWLTQGPAVRERKRKEKTTLAVTATISDSTAGTAVRDEVNHSLREARPAAEGLYWGTLLPTAPACADRPAQQGGRGGAGGGMQAPGAHGL